MGKPDPFLLPAKFRNIFGTKRMSDFEIIGQAGKNAHPAEELMV